MERRCVTSHRLRRLARIPSRAGGQDERFFAAWQEIIGDKGVHHRNHRQRARADGRSANERPWADLQRP